MLPACDPFYSDGTGSGRGPVKTARSATGLTMCKTIISVCGECFSLLGATGRLEGCPGNETKSMLMSLKNPFFHPGCWWHWKGPLKLSHWTVGMSLFFYFQKSTAIGKRIKLTMNCLYTSVQNIELFSG